MSHLDAKCVTFIVKMASEMCFSNITYECVQLQEKSLLFHCQMLNSLCVDFQSLSYQITAAM